jgi:lipooligosaccharide transport system ATP-binding protein
MSDARDQNSPGHGGMGDPGIEPAVLARELAKSYGDRVAVDGIDFEVPAGICFGFLGPNGAGKTTTMKMIYGLARVGEGELRVLGMDARRERREIKSRIGVVSQETNLDGDLTVRENLLQQATYFGIDAHAATPRVDELLDFSLLTDRGGDRVQALSGGMKRRLMVARSMVNDPELIVLDEPTTGLDPQARLAVWRSLERLKRRGVTLLLTTHYMEEAARLCDRLLIMDEGRIVTEGAPPELVQRHAGREALELELGDDCDAAALIDTIAERADGHELHEGALTLFAEDAEELLRSIDHDRFPTDSAVVRRATLEDVFLRLTGRSLREGE